jgi:HEAT repeat protein
MVLADPVLFEEVFAAIRDRDPVVRKRASDVAEKVTARRPELLAAHKGVLLSDLAHNPQEEVRWHIVQMLPRVDLDDAERHRAGELLMGLLHDDSKLVRVNAMESLAQLARADEDLRSRVIVAFDELSHSGSPAERTRARRLLAGLMPG